MKEVNIRYISGYLYLSLDKKYKEMNDAWIEFPVDAIVRKIDILAGLLARHLDSILINSQDAHLYTTTCHVTKEAILAAYKSELQRERELETSDLFKLSEQDFEMTLSVASSTLDQYIGTVMRDDDEFPIEPYSRV